MDFNFSSSQRKLFIKDLRFHLFLPKPFPNPIQSNFSVRGVDECINFVIIRWGGSQEMSTLRVKEELEKEYNLMSPIAIEKKKN